MAPTARARSLRLRIVHEGDDDRALLEGLGGLGLLPPNCEVSRRPKAEPSGVAAVVRDTITSLHAGTHCIAVRDLDELRPADAVDQLIGHLTRAGLPVTTRVPIGGSDRATLLTSGGANGPASVALILVGLPADALPLELGVTQFAIDDYVLRAMHEPDVYAAISEREIAEHAKAWEKMRELRDLFVANGARIVSSKRWAHLLRAVIGFRAAPATFAERVVRCAAQVQGPKARALFEPLVTDLQEAVKAIP